VAEQAKEHTRIDAPVEECFGTLTDFERYPEWAGDLKEARIVERDDQGRALVVEYRAAGMGRSTTYRLRYDYTDAPHRLGWQLDTGDIQRELDGAYELRPAEGDAAATDVSCSDVMKQAKCRAKASAVKSLIRRSSRRPKADCNAARSKVQRPLVRLTTSPSPTGAAIASTASRSVGLPWPCR